MWLLRLCGGEAPDDPRLVDRTQRFPRVRARMARRGAAQRGGRWLSRRPRAPQVSSRRPIIRRDIASPGTRTRSS